MVLSAVIAGALMLFMSSCTSDSGYKELPDADIRNLKWGMSLEEVKLYESEVITKETYFKADGPIEAHTGLTYENVKIPEIRNHNFEMIISVYDDYGLMGVNYSIEGGDLSEVYQYFYDDNTVKYGEGNVGFIHTNSDGSVSSALIEWKDQNDTTIAIIYDDGSNGRTSSLLCAYSCKMPKTGKIKQNDNAGVKSNSDSATTGEKNALQKANKYLDSMPFSYSGLIKQLEYEGYTTSEATYGADNCGADWNEQAAKMAKRYLKTMPFSRQELIDQLEYEGFTHSQAVYGAEQNGY